MCFEWFLYTLSALFPSVINRGLAGTDEGLPCWPCAPPSSVVLGRRLRQQWHLQGMPQRTHHLPDNRTCHWCLNAIHVAVQSTQWREKEIVTDKTVGYLLNLYGCSQYAHPGVPGRKVSAFGDMRWEQGQNMQNEDAQNGRNPGIIVGPETLCSLSGHFNYKIWWNFNSERSADRFKDPKSTYYFILWWKKSFEESKNLYPRQIKHSPDFWKPPKTLTLLIPIIFLFIFSKFWRKNKQLKNPIIWMEKN